MTCSKAPLAAAAMLYKAATSDVGSSKWRVLNGSARLVFALFDYLLNDCYVDGGSEVVFQLLLRRSSQKALIALGGE